MRSLAQKSPDTENHRDTAPGAVRRGPTRPGRNGTSLTALQRMIAGSSRLEQSAEMQARVNGLVIQRGTDDGGAATPTTRPESGPETGPVAGPENTPAAARPAPAILRSPVLELFRSDPAAGHALAQRLLPHIPALRLAGQPGVTPPPLAAYHNPVLRAYRDNPAQARLLFQPLLPAPNLLLPFLPLGIVPFVYPGVMTPLMLRRPRPQNSANWDMLSWAVGTAIQGVADCIDTVAGGARRIGHTMGAEGPERQQQARAENARFLELARQVVHQPKATIDEIGDLVMESYVERAEKEQLHQLAYTSAQEHLIKGVAGTAATYAATKLPVKYLITKPHVMPPVMAGLRARAMLSPAAYRSQIVGLLESRVSRFFIGRAVGSVVSLPVTVALAGVTAAGFVEQSLQASEKLRKQDPELWAKLRAKNLDLAAVLVEDILDKMNDAKMPIRPGAVAPPDNSKSTEDR